MTSIKCSTKRENYNRISTILTPKGADIKI
nr:MAG TPA: hypothetical protein [Caudoviricetes sp.]